MANDKNFVVKNGLDVGQDLTANNITANTVNADLAGNATTASSLETARTIALSGAVTGSASFDGSSNITIAATATADPTLTISGDASGSATFTNLGNATLSLTIADDSHNHIISNIDGLQTALNNKADDSTTVTAGAGLIGGGTLGSNFTISHADTSSQGSLVTLSGVAIVSDIDLDTYGHVTNLATRNLTTSDINSLNVDADTLDGQEGTYYLNWTNTTNKPDPTLTISGDASGSATFTNLGNATLTLTIADDSHNHVISNIDGLQNALDSKTTESYVDTQISNLVDSSPATLDTLNELAAALGDDPNFATTVSNEIGTKANSSITISAGGGLTGGGNLTANRTISHADTSAQASLTALTGANVVSDIDLDTYGHVTNLSTRAMTLGDLGYTGATNADNYNGWDLFTDGTSRGRVTSGENVNIVGGSNVSLGYSATNNTITINASATPPNDATITLSAGGGLTGGGSFTTDQATNETITVNHADTSSQGSVNNSGGTVIQDVTLDGYGHITNLNSVNLDGRYYTESEADSRFVNVTGDTMTGDLTVQANTNIESVINFISANNDTITVTMLDGGTLSFEGASGQLFSITDTLSGTIFSVNDISGIPSIDVDDDGTIRLAEFSGNVLIGTATDNGTDILQVDGSVSATSFSGDGSSLTNVDADRLDGLNSSQFLRSDTSDTMNGRLEMGAVLDMNNNDIYGVDQIFHNGDTNTYMQFHAADQWRVVTGGSQRLEVNNTLITSSEPINAPDFNSTSDRNLKEDIVKIDDALDKIKKVNGYTFTYKKDKTRAAGVIAQEVEEILPEVVNGEEGHKTVSYGNMVGLLIEAIKEQQKEIEELKSQIYK